MEQLRKEQIWKPLAVLCLAALAYWALLPVYPGYGRPSLFGWLVLSWNPETEYEHGWAVPFLFVYFCYLAFKKMDISTFQKSTFGLVLFLFGVLLYVVSVRTIQPRLAMFGLPFIFYGGTRYVLGKEAAKYMIFPSLFILFAVPMPGLQHATNTLQIWVTKSCFWLGTTLGMEINLVGSTIKSSTGGWHGFDIAEGCSGIRSLMALTMISAVYAYYTQSVLWKKLFVFFCAVPIAILVNIIRVFSILVIAEMGYSKFAAGFYHDWTGLILFFPLAVLFLFLIDKMLNPRKKVVRKRVVK